MKVTTSVTNPAAMDNRQENARESIRCEAGTQVKARLPLAMNTGPRLP